MSITTEQLSRLEQMCESGQQTWDLSPNDVTAIRAAVETIKTFDEELLDYFAGQALSAILAPSSFDTDYAADRAYRFAEAMMEKKAKLQKGE